jgi:hypothetical protein
METKKGPGKAPHFFSNNSSQVCGRKFTGSIANNVVSPVLLGNDALDLEAGGTIRVLFMDGACPQVEMAFYRQVEPNRFAQVPMLPLSLGDLGALGAHLADCHQEAMERRMLHFPEEGGGRLRSLKDLGQAIDALAIDVSMHHAASDMSVQQQIERANEGLRKAQIWLRRANQELEAKNAGAE